MQNDVVSEKAPEGAVRKLPVADENYMRTLDACANIFKEATGRTIAMTPTFHQGRRCIAWMVSEPDLPGELGGVEWVNLVGE